MGTDIHGKMLDRYNRQVSIPEGRNYQLFAALSGVRNGFGFAGSAWGEPLTPISEPRGLHERVHKPYFNETVNLDDFGDHSFSWLSIKEILEWDGWDKTLQREGVLDRATYESWDRAKNPEQWSGAVMGPNIIHADEMTGSFPEGWTHIRCQWAVSTLKESCSTFWLWLEWIKVEFYWQLDECILVFGFDS